MGACLLCWGAGFAGRWFRDVVRRVGPKGPGRGPGQGRGAQGPSGGGPKGPGPGPFDLITFLGGRLCYGFGAPVSMEPLSKSGKLWF